MGYIDESISKVISIKIKPRQDSASDQYNRILMVKMCILSSVIIGMNYFSDQVDCIIANTNGVGGGFVGATCWIQGFYIYKEMQDMVKDSGYYGIPRNMDYDGLNSNGELCATVNRALDKIKDCTPMTKSYYLQFQYMPFYIAILALFYYVPYMIFKTVNTDMKSLKETLKNEDISAQDLMDNYFSYSVNPKKRLRMRVIVNIFIKILYLVVNVFALLATDRILDGNFLAFGAKWVEWSKLPSNIAHDHSMRDRHTVKPANLLLPAMGFCDIHEATRDQRNTHINQHKFICEISPHVLYQYVLMILWFLIIIGLLISILGLLHMLFNIVCSVACFQTYDGRSRKLFKQITLREIDYLEYIRRKNLPMYGEVCKLLKEHKEVEIPLVSKGNKKEII